MSVSAIDRYVGRCKKLSESVVRCRTESDPTVLEKLLRKYRRTRIRGRQLRSEADG